MIIVIIIVIMIKRMKSNRTSNEHVRKQKSH